MVEKETVKAHIEGELGGVVTDRDINCFFLGERSHRVMSKDELKKFTDDAKIYGDKIISDAKIERDAIIFNANTEAERIRNNAKAELESAAVRRRLEEEIKESKQRKENKLHWIYSGISFFSFVLACSFLHLSSAKFVDHICLVFAAMSAVLTGIFVSLSIKKWIWWPVSMVLLIVFFIVNGSFLPKEVLDRLLD